MKRTIVILSAGIYWVGALTGGLPGAWAQTGDAPPPTAQTTPPAVVSALPPGAVQDGQIVSHPLTGEENLHLLAAFYYNNPRRWKEIYEQNRHLLRNPNRLPGGVTIKIQVAETWKPLLPWDQFYQLAVRNGQWTKGQPWKRARSGTLTPAAQPASPEAAAPNAEAAQPVAAPTPLPAETPPLPTEPAAAVTPATAPTETPQAITPVTQPADAAPAESPAPTPTPEEIAPVLDGG